MLNWDDMRHLVALADTGSLSAAARTLRVEHATVARRIAALERDLNARLVDRRGGRYRLTSIGQRAVAHARRMQDEVLAVERAALGSEAEVTGEIAVTAPPTMVTELIVPRLPQLRARHPGLYLRLVGASHTLSLTRREADIALRLSRPDTPSLVVRRAGSIAYGLFASAEYLKTHAEPGYEFVGLEEDLADVAQQAWLTSLLGRRRIVFRSNDLSVQCALVKAGLGVAALPRFLGAAHGFAALDPAAGVSRDVWLTYHSDLKPSRAIHAVSEFLVGCIPPAGPGAEGSRSLPAPKLRSRS